MSKLKLLLGGLLLLASQYCAASSYQYDTLNRLTRTIYNNGQSVDYAYDAGGNLLSVTSNTLAVPDPFAFTAQTGVPLNTLTVSNATSVTGINAAPSISITGGEYSINGGTYTTLPGNVLNGDNVTVRLTSSNAYSTPTSATLTIGGVSGTFTATTATPPPLPTAFTLTAKTGAALNSWISSNVVTIGGLPVATASDISIVGGEYSINGGAYTAASGTISNAQTVAVRMQASANYLTTTTATLTVGGLSVPFSVTTADIPSVTVNLTAGWNLLGNSTDAPLDVAVTLGDATKITTVWKWIPATSKWAFYAPSMAATSLATYAASKGYDVLTTINGGEGFWVNAKTAFTAQLPAGISIGASYFQGQLDPTLNKLLKGWNLIATGDNVTPSVFNQSLSGIIPLNVTTLWAWDSALSNWYFYAPSLEANNTLANYIITKSYLDFTQRNKTLGQGVGFWVNKP